MSVEAAFPGGSSVKSLLAMWETWVRSLGWEDPLEKEMAAHSNILAWRIPWTEEPGGLQSTGSQSVLRKEIRKITGVNNTPELPAKGVYSL